MSTAHKKQGLKGIRQLLIILCTYPLMLHKITPSKDYKFLAETQVDEPTNQNSIQVPKVVNLGD